MGLYDSFLTAQIINCPTCNNVFSGEDWQTKDLGCDLQTYSVGDRVKDNALEIVAGKVECYDYCEVCKKLVYAKAIIEGGKFVRIELQERNENIE